MVDNRNVTIDDNHVMIGDIHMRCYSCDKFHVVIDNSLVTISMCDDGQLRA